MTQRGLSSITENKDEWALQREHRRAPAPGPVPPAAAPPAACPAATGVRGGTAGSLQGRLVTATAGSTRCGLAGSRHQLVQVQGAHCFMFGTS